MIDGEIVVLSRQHLLLAEKPAVDEQNNVQHEEESEHEEHTLCEASDLPDLTNDLSQTEQSNLAGSSQGEINILQLNS